MTALTETPQVEKQIVTDMARRAALVAPALVAAGAIGWGVHGALSVLYALAIVLVNYGLSAAIVGRAAKASPGFMMGAVLGGFLFRMVLVALAVALVNDAGWVSRLPLGVAIVATHLGLLIWEAKYLSVSLAFPALKPKASLPAPEARLRGGS